MNGYTMEKLNQMREFLGFPFVVSSAYRCPEYNDKKSHTGLVGPHTTGRAIDIQISHNRAFEIITNASKFGFTGIGINQKGDKRFIHLDDLPNSKDQPRPTVWSY